MIAADSLRACWPWAAAAALHGLRLLPVAVLSPFLGGPLAPSVVRAGLAFGLGAAVWSAAGGVRFDGTGWDLLAAGARELALGTALGFLATIPLDAARAGGRLIDTVRGATLAELHVPVVRQRETASGDLLVQWTVVLAGAAGGDRLIVNALWSSFAAIPVGAGLPRAAVLEVALRGSAEVLAIAVCLAAPSVAGVLAADLALALAARAAPGLGAAQPAQPARAAIGLAGLAVATSVLAGRLVSLVALSSGWMRSLASAGLTP
jgi:type III secretory pathway component EscT